jgi:signal transduction histidine kinase
MTSDSISREQLERELVFYRTEYNEIGARLLRLQDEQSRTAREARRSRTVARLIREAYSIADHEIPAEMLGEPLLAVIADASLCDRAAFLREDELRPGCFVIEHAVGASVGATVVLNSVSRFLYTAAHQPPGRDAHPLTELIGAPFLLWAYEPASHRALLLANSNESNVHRPFEANDHELVDGALAVYIDVLLKKSAETTLRQAKIAAEEASNARARFLASLSHELATPLNAIIGFSELLLTNERQEAPKRVEFLRQILDAGRGLQSLIKDILDFSSFSNAVPLLRRSWTPIEPLLHAAMRASIPASQIKGVSITALPVAYSFEAFIDYDKFRQIMSNLIGNAIKFTKAGGQITILSDITADGATNIVIRDTGIGITRQDISRVLEPFVQVGADQRGPKLGAGLGLPIAKQLTEAHGGQLLIESILGEGTTVIVSLPRGSARRKGV